MTVQHRRRREQKTDYRLRLALLKSGKPRLVIRKSNRYIYAQMIAYDEDGDEVLVQANSKELKELGWTGNCSNTTASYLTGRLLAERSDVSEAVLDIGLQNNSPGGVLYACMKGVLDGGIEVPHDDDVFPPDERTDGRYINAEDDYEEVIQGIEG